MTDRVRPSQLSPTEIESVLAKLGGDWRLVDSTLERRWEFPSFDQAMAFVAAVALVAEEVDHHPDILIEYTKVTLNLWTHVTGGITERDVRLAHRLNELG
ncbi:4a-hydroxytetrahydrobiopterin dehydratase [Candidatus Berkelbacteria bacterium]|nr:4a-hydroxytetrahydrobiopterin dehydratase [Candidatus Berkelbacteria bacterium]